MAGYIPQGVGNGRDPVQFLIGIGCLPTLGVPLGSDHPVLVVIGVAHRGIAPGIHLGQHLMIGVVGIG